LLSTFGFGAEKAEKKLGTSGFFEIGASTSFGVSILATTGVGSGFLLSTFFFGAEKKKFCFFEIAASFGVLILATMGGGSDVFSTLCAASFFGTCFDSTTTLAGSSFLTSTFCLFSSSCRAILLPVL